MKTLNKFKNLRSLRSLGRAKICDEMVGTWYTDITVDSNEYGKQRHITKLIRHPDGTAKLKGLTIYLDLKDSSVWEFPSDWSCNKDWYTEKNEWGYTSFKILSLGDENVLKDERSNLNKSKVTLVERKVISFKDSKIKEYFK